MTDEVRVSDAERQQVVDRLRDETAAGRLTLEEFDERVTEVYAAKTRADLRVALRELPDAEPPVPATMSPVASAPIPASLLDDDDLPPELERRARRMWRQKLRNDLTGFATANGICVSVWAMSTGMDGYFWPGWVIMGTGIGVVSSLTGGVEEQRKVLRRKLKKEQAKQLKQQTA